MHPSQYPEPLRELVLADSLGSWANSDRSARVDCTPHMWRWTIDGVAGSSDMVEDVIDALRPVRA